MMVVAGIVGSSVFQHKEFFELEVGQEVAFADNTLKYVALHEDDHVNYIAVRAEMLFTDATGKAIILRPQKRFYHKHMDQPNTQVSLNTDLKRDIYLTLGGWEANGARIGIEAIINPLVSWFWIGGIVMTVGAIFCMLPRFIPQAAPVVAASNEPKGVRGGRLSLTTSS
jgi:cytochrome c-type biogenesis protein CcmF